MASISSVVLLSGGLDSTVNMKRAVDEGECLLALTFDYGQRAAKREIESAAAICKLLGARHEVVTIPWLGRLKESALTKVALPLPTPRASELDETEAARRSADAVWIPNRNGLFLNVGAAFAEALGGGRVVVGFNAEEAMTFPDNSENFLRAVNETFRFSTRGKVTAFSYTADMRKREIVQLAREIEAPLELAWPCYDGGAEWCGLCESCMRFWRAVREAGCEEWLAARRRKGRGVILDRNDRSC